MASIQPKISNLIQQQFPGYYRENGPVFVEFVTQYYKWMESITSKQANTVDSLTTYVDVKSTNNVIVGTNTQFQSFFSNGDNISIYIDSESDSYKIFTIDTISNNTYLTLTTRPDFTAAKTKYGTVTEQINPLYFTRNFSQLKDVDDTLEQFIIYFKNKYLTNIQFDTVTDIRGLIKHALDIYRSKGTERSIDLMFKAVFGVPASVYYPSEDLFRLSDGKWLVPRYLEFAPNDNLVKFSGKQIQGVSSGATAFCEAVVRKIINGKIIDVCFISAINGTFRTGELVNSSLSPLTPEQLPVIVGSLTEINIDVAGTGDQFTVGQRVQILSNSGVGALGRVVNLSSTSGTVTPLLIDGGYGYSANANVYISENLFTVSGISITSETPTEVFPFLHRVIQPSANINYNNANGTFANNDLIFTYHANNDVKGQGRVLNVVQSNSSAGELQISVLSGNMQAAEFYKQSNAVVANQTSTNGYYNTSANGRIIGINSNVSIKLTDLSGTFLPDEEIYQVNSSNVQICNASFVQVDLLSGTNATIRVANISTGFITGKTIVGKQSNATANVVSLAITVGVDLVNGTFISTQNNYVYVSNSSTNGMVSTVFLGSDFSLSYSNDFIYTEQIPINTDLISPYLTVDLANVAFGLPGNTAANLTYVTIQDSLTYTNTTIGKIQYITNVNRGSDYTAVPIVRIQDTLTSQYLIPDKSYITYTGATKSFTPGELVTQQATGARGLVNSSLSNTTVLVVQRLRFSDSNNFTITSNSTTTIIGDQSGATANVTLVNNYSFDVIGNNALIDLSVTVSNSAISSIELIDSGFGFVDREQVTLLNTQNTALSGTGTASVQTTGKSIGRYLRKGGFLSDTKKLFDGYYWQHLSYEVRSSVILDKYIDMLKQVLHVAGTQYFGAYIDDSKISVAVEATATITVE